ncbi:MAG TPA: septation protein A [Burkholderiaceae bacterium]|jgi:intracellular septation protein|nr:septation protein A [Burkholderiaceae bacterium]
MKFLFDLFPVALFFAVFKWADGHTDAALGLVNRFLSGFVSGGAITADQAPILLATAIAVLASVAQIAYLLIRRKKIDGMLWISVFVIVVFGSLTIYFNDKTFIKLKPTVIYWCFAIGLAFGQLFLKKNMIRTMMEEQIKLPNHVWNRLNLAWIGFFTAMGILNLFVAFVLFKGNDAAWVNFKAFGCTGLMIVFVICQSVFLAKYMEEPK